MNTKQQEVTQAIPDRVGQELVNEINRKAQPLSRRYAKDFNNDAIFDSARRSRKLGKSMWDL
jgi:hypothetical protein